jgi:uncharacterized protein
MNKLIVIPIVTAVLLLIDWYVWQAIKVAVNGTSSNTQVTVKYLFWGLTAFTLLGMWLYNFTNPDLLGKNLRTIIMVGVFISYFSKIFAIVFILIDDIGRLIRWIFSKISSQSANNESITNASKGISRSEFLMKTAVVAGAIPAIGMTWGIISGAHDYRIRRVKLAIKNLPKAFQGMTIGQISDIHSGSFFNKTAVKGGVEMFMKEKPDLAFFTGDLVNSRADEVQDYIDIFNKIKAPLGVFSTFGNHDYGDYVQWPTEAAKRQNLKDLALAHKVLGYDLLRDQNRTITLGGEKLAIIGVENISGHSTRFHSYGDLAKAVKGTEEIPTKLLLSHDPTHWDKEVNTKYKDIDVMFSGHTHGTQFGITIGEKTYSPAQWVYKQWAGLYEQGNQKLYVNRGYGYLGYPGRIGMPPEITIFELVSA